MILNNNSTQQINTLLIQLQNRITNSTNEFIKLNDKLNNKIDNKIDNLDSKISDLEKNNDYDVSEMNAKIKANTEAISGKADKNHTHIKSEITDFDHTHDDRYYTESEVDTKLSGKADKRHTHTKSQITDFPTSLKNPNALTINGKTYDGSSAVDAGVQTVANGGTGVTTQADINKAFIGNLDTGESDVTDGTEFVSSWASDNGFAETTDGALNTPYKRKFILVWNYIKNKISSVLGLTKDNYGGKAAKSSFLDEYVGAGGTRPTSGNIVPKDASEYGGMRKDVATSSMTNSGIPGYDGHLLTMFWDNAGRYDSQFFVSNNNPPAVKVRTKANATDYGTWTDIITSNNIGSQTVANADRANTAGTADSAATILDSNNGTPIKVRWGGPAIDSAEWYPAFNADGSALEPINGANIHAGTADRANALAYRGGITNTDTFQEVMNNDGKWRITDLDSGWNGSLYSFHTGGSQSGLMFRIRGGSSDIRNIEVNYSIDSKRFVGPWKSLIGQIPIGAPSSPKDGDIWIER